MTTLASIWLANSLTAAFIVLCLFMMLVILIQKPRGGGLSGAFGGAGGGVQTAFGAKVGDVLTWVTVVCFALFLLLGMGITWAITAHVEGTSTTQPATPAVAPLNPAPLQPAPAGETETQLDPIVVPPATQTAPPATTQP